MPVSDYCTKSDIKLLVSGPSWGTSHDSALDLVITCASRAIDRSTKREPGSFATGTAGTVRYFDGSGHARLLIDELADVPAQVAVDETGNHTYVIWATTDYIVWPYNTKPINRLDIDVWASTKTLWYKFAKAVKITGSWGYSLIVPDDIKMAAIIQAIRWFKRGQQGFADVGAIAELNQLRYVTPVDPDIENILSNGGYIRMTI